MAAAPIAAVLLPSLPSPSSNNDDVFIAIPYKSICDSFICPICLEEITDAHMTHCGHNACENCIREALNRRHVCPICNQATTAPQLVKNHAFDSLFQRAKAAKEAASRGYIESLMKRARIGEPSPAPSSALSSSSSSSSPASVASISSPIEAVFQKHVRRSLLMYDDYYHELRASFEKKRATLTADYRNQLDTLQSKLHVAHEQKDQPGAPLPIAVALPSTSPSVTRSGSSEQPSRAIELLHEHHQKEMADLSARFDKSVSLLVQAYDTYMSSIAPSPFLLPVKVTLIAVDRSPQLRCDVALRSTDAISDIRQILMEKSVEIGSPIGEYGSDVKIWAHRPSTIASAAGDAKSSITIAGATLISDEKLTIAELKLEQGSYLLISGSVRLKSEETAKCFTAIYFAGGEQRVDYFKCADCDCNWICKSCATHCHAGHRLTTFFTAHKPSYACCYCVKKRTCKLENNKSASYRPPTVAVQP